MAEGGELEAVIKGLAKDADQAAGDIAESVAKFAEKTADIEEANVSRIVETDAKAADRIAEAGRGGGPPEGGAPGGGGSPGRTFNPPNNRHDLNRIGPKNPTKAKNTVVLPGTDVAKDLDDLAAGRGTWNPTTNRWEVNGRTYGVEPNGTVYPVDGPGFVNLSRSEYKVLKQLIAAKGDVAAARTALGRDPSVSESDWQAALDVFKYHKNYQGGS